MFKRSLATVFLCAAPLLAVMPEALADPFCDITTHQKAGESALKLKALLAEKTRIESDPAQQERLNSLLEIAGLQDIMPSYKEYFDALIDDAGKDQPLPLPSCQPG